jgi:hypothetical protein
VVAAGGATPGGNNVFASETTLAGAAAVLN